VHAKPDAPPPASFRLWSLRDDVVVDSSADPLTVVTRWGDIEIAAPSPVVRECLDRMSLGPVSLPKVTGTALADLHRLLERLHSCVVRSLDVDDLAGPLLSVVPVAEHARFALPAIGGEDLVRLSRFTAMRTSADELVLESPLARHRVLLHRSLPSSVAGTLGRAVAVNELAAAVDSDLGLVSEIVAHLVAAGVVVLGERDETTGQPVFAEDRDPRLVQWSHHDLLFHTRSRMGRNDEPLGAAYRHVGEISPQPAVKPAPPGPRIPLHRPDLADLRTTDPALTEVIESRRSFRELAPLSVTELGDLLFRTARVRSFRDATGAGGVRYPVTDRPYPSSDSLYELELYVSVDACEGLERGVYHYDPAEHALTLLSTEESRLAELLDDAKVLTGTLRRPPALITMTARMARLSWVYDGIAYATALKHVGVLQQTLYLVATAMGLAPCALAVGDSDAATEALGLDWPAEVSIGEFVVGRRA